VYVDDNFERAIYLFYSNYVHTCIKNITYCVQCTIYITRNRKNKLFTKTDLAYISLISIFLPDKNNGGSIFHQQYLKLIGQGTETENRLKTRAPFKQGDAPQIGFGHRKVHIL
jgi:hypothetical protein